MNNTSSEYYFRQKRILPCELNESDFMKLSAYTRERSFIIPSVTELSILNLYRKHIIRILKGKELESEALDSLYRFYSRNGYKAVYSDDEGELIAYIKKGVEVNETPINYQYYMPVSYMESILDLNVGFARGWMRRQQFMGSVINPALKLCVHGNKKREIMNKWQQKWKDAGESVSWQGASPDPMVAFFNSPIWMALSDFGFPYCPFSYDDYLSLDVQFVSLNYCLKLGLMPDLETKEGQSFFKSLHQYDEYYANGAHYFPTPLSDQDINNDLAASLPNIARYDGTAIVYI